MKEPIAPRRAAILAALKEIPQTIEDVAARAGCSTSWAREVVSQLRTEKIVYVSRWIPGERRHVAVFAVGARKDAAKPPPKTRKVVCAAWRERNRVLCTVRRRKKPTSPWEALL